jgi:hypothetical protein
LPSGWSFDSANGHYYRYVSASQVAWSAASTVAIADGGYLATITDASENTFVHNLVGSHNAWLGGSDAVHEGTWAWVVATLAVQSSRKWTSARGGQTSIST